MNFCFFYSDEDSDDDPSVNEMSDREVPLTYEIIEGGTKRGGAKLVDSLGFQYNVKRKYKTTTHWQCTVRPKGNTCRVVVLEEKEVNTFTRRGIHNHEPDVGAKLATEIVTAVKQEAVNDVYKSAAKIVKEVIKQTITQSGF